MAGPTEPRDSRSLFIVHSFIVHSFIVYTSTANAVVFGKALSHPHLFYKEKTLVLGFPSRFWVY